MTLLGFLLTQDLKMIQSFKRQSKQALVINDPALMDIFVSTRFEDDPKLLAKYNKQIQRHSQS